MVGAITLSFILIMLIYNYKIVLEVINNFIAILHPFIFAFIIAYILNPLMSFFQRKLKINRGKSILLTYSIIITLFIILIIFVFPKIGENIADLLKNIPVFVEQTKAWINKIVSNTRIINTIYSEDFLKNNINLALPKLSNILIQSFDTILMKTISFTSFSIKIVFGLIISIYILKDKEKFLEIGKKFVYIILKKRRADGFFNLLNNFHYMISLYIGTKALDSLIIAIICLIGVSLLKSPYALLISVIVGFTNMIPYFGPFIGMIVAFLINLFFSPIRALGILIFLFLLQQFDAWYLDPKLIGHKVGLSPFLVIFAVTIGGGLFGVIGMLLGVPVMAVIKIYIDKLLKNHAYSEEGFLNVNK
jgi:predicted PurR-regulated permease PerM